MDAEPYACLQGQVVLVTGGSRGLGLAIAEEFAQQGAKLALCAREKDELEQARLKLLDLQAIYSRSSAMSQSQKKYRAP